MHRARPGDDWDFYMDERTNRICDYAPEDEIRGGRFWLRQRAKAIAEREARKMGLEPPGPERTTQPQQGDKMEGK